MGIGKIMMLLAFWMFTLKYISVVSQHSHFLAGPVDSMWFFLSMIMLIFFKIMCFAASRKANSTFQLVFADVSNMKARSLSFMNFSAFSTETALLNQPKFTKIRDPFEPQLGRILNSGNNSRWLLCTNAPILKKFKINTQTKI